ncbi:MAG TPA: ATP-binding protein [Symbiobacteriaceae bacterium]|nr:ATP-binding protein [Symbiobacteriaceae bacterium]
MKRIGVRLTLTLAAVALVAGVTTAGAVLWAANSEFSGYRAQQGDRRVEELQQFLAAYYRAGNSWEGVDQFLTPSHGAMMHDVHARTGLQEAMSGMMALIDLGARRVAIVGPDGRTVADTAGSAGTLVPSAQLAAGHPITVDGRQVGTLLLDRPAVPPLSAMDRFLVHRMVFSAVLSGLGSALLAGTLGLVLARRITNPLGHLTRAAGQLARRDMTVRVPILGDDELALLGQEFNRMAGQLEKQEQLRRSMVADVAHELRTPVTFLRSQFEAIQDGAAEPGPETLLPMQDEVIRLSRLLDDLQALSLADAGQLPLHLQQIRPLILTEAVAGAFRVAAGAKGVHFDYAPAADVPEIQVDPDRMKQVLLNLLGNALRHTPEGGAITLAVGAAGEGVIITVADTGEGISPEDLPHVFDRFYRADKSRSRAGGGSGLGLAISRGIVAAHGGSIQAESTPGKGSRFSVTLPACKSA